MKVFEVITENNQQVDVTKVVQFIRKHCHQWLDETGGKHPIYRGFASPPKQNIVIRDVRKNRQPLNSRTKDHHAFNKMIKICGKVANRSNAVFVTGNKFWAKMYGELRVVIPVGNFNYTWHALHGDWMADTREILSVGRNDSNYAISGDKEDSDIEHPIDVPYTKKLFCPGLLGDDGTLLNALKQGNEIMISCDKILVIRPEVYPNIIRALHE